MSNDLEPKAGAKPMVVDDSAFAHLLDTNKFEHLWRVAKTFAATNLVPELFRNKPENCFVGLQMALRSGIDPLLFLQNCYVIQGKPAVETKLAVAMLINSGLIEGTIDYQFTGTGNNLACTASVTLKKTGERVEHTLTWDTVTKNGWAAKDGWKKDPVLMMQYRSAMRLIRSHFPDVLLGCYSKEEASDMQTINSTAKQVRPAGKLQERALPAPPTLLPAAPPAPETVEHGDAWEPDADELDQIAKKESEA